MGATADPQQWGVKTDGVLPPTLPLHQASTATPTPIPPQAAPLLLGLPGSMPCTKYVLPALKFLVITNLLFVYKLHSYFPIFIVDNLQLIKSSRGRYQLVHNGFIYNTDRQSGQRVFWHCSEYQRIGCRGRVVTVVSHLLEKCSTQLWITRWENSGKKGNGWN